MVTIPNGTLNRWDVISIWMADHGVEKERDGKTILKKSKGAGENGSTGTTRFDRRIPKVPRGTSEKETRGQSQLG